MATSGTTSFQLSGADLLLEAFERIGVRAAEITADQVVSARRSMNLVQARWANRGTNLWKVNPSGAPLAISLSQGVASYNVPGSAVMLLDCYLRTFPMAAPVSLGPAFSTSNGSASVGVTWADNGLGVSDFVNVIVPVAVGGLVLQGFYPVASVVSASAFTITAAANASSNASGGAAPTFATVSGSELVTVALANHGLIAGATFAVGVPTTVGGVTLSGDYIVASVTNANSFVIASGTVAGKTATGSENGGLAQLAGQVASTDPQDRILTPISRSDYAAYPDKGVEASPTVYLFDRQAVLPTVTLWPVPDSNGPYQLLAYTVSQLQDATTLASEAPDIPYRFSEALCADLALHLARKYPPNPQSGITIADLKLAAAEAWEEAAAEDRERVSLFMVPDFSSYFR